MRHLLFSARLPGGHEICISPVSIDVFEANEAECLGDDTGYFICEFDSQQPDAGIEILAKTASYDAAMRIIEIFLYALGAARTNSKTVLCDKRW